MPVRQAITAKSATSELLKKAPAKLPTAIYVGRRLFGWLFCLFGILSLVFGYSSLAIVFVWGIYSLLETHSVEHNPQPGLNNLTGIDAAFGQSRKIPKGVTLGILRLLLKMLHHPGGLFV
jgi:hypothetical protein